MRYGNKMTKGWEAVSDFIGYAANTVVHISYALKGAYHLK